MMKRLLMCAGLCLFAGCATNNDQSEPNPDTQDMAMARDAAANNESDGDASPGEDMRGDDLDMGSSDSGGADASDASGQDMAEPDMSRSVECMTAQPLEFGANTTGRLEMPGDRLYYSFQAGAGQWLLLAGQGTPRVAVLLRDADGEQVAFAQLAPNGNETIWYHSTTDQTLCVEVIEYADFDGEAPAGNVNFALLLQDPEDFVGAEVEPNDTQDDASPLFFFESMPEFWNAPFFGFYEPDETDWFRFQPQIPDSTFILRFPAMGVDGHGSTTAPGVVSVYGSGPEPIASIDGQTNPQFIQLRVPEGANGPERLYVELQAPTSRGSNAFYYLPGTVQTESTPTEADDVANANRATPEVMTSTFSPDGRSYFLTGTIPAGDVDRWAFDASVGETVRLACSARRNGMGVVDMTVKLVNAADAVLAEEVESDATDMYWGPGGTQGEVAIGTNATYQLVLEAGSDHPNISGREYRCGVHVDEP